jgi:KipI family sensor histidine kinase inhibitor
VITKARCASETISFESWEILMLSLEPLGDRAFLTHFADEREAARWVAAVRAARFPGVTDVVLAYRSASVFADPEQGSLEALEERLRSVQSGSDNAQEGKLLVIPVFYDGQDLHQVADQLGLALEQVIHLHASPVYDVFAIGFLQGFPYAGYLAPALSGLARRDEPRLKVPAGSVAIAGRQTGIYPHESPGGWHLLGRTPLRIAEPDEGYFPIRAGDRIRFQSIDAREFQDRLDERL